VKRNPILVGVAIAIVTSPIWFWIVWGLMVAPLLVIGLAAFAAAVFWALRYLDDNPDGGVDY
jgi:protein-S-isoprenylcysteine O-methyltransferase Ste14